MCVLAESGQIIEILRPPVPMVAGGSRDAAVEDPARLALELRPVVVVASLHLVGGGAAAEEKAVREAEGHLVRRQTGRLRHARRLRDLGEFPHEIVPALARDPELLLAHRGERSLRQSLAGAEVAEVYLTLPAAANEPAKRLAGYTRVSLQPGESQNVELTIDPTSPRRSSVPPASAPAVRTGAPSTTTCTRWS